jgi:hypothetical protein
LGHIGQAIAIGVNLGMLTSVISQPRYMFLRVLERITHRVIGPDPVEEQLRE